MEERERAQHEVLRIREVERARASQVGLRSGMDEHERAHHGELRRRAQQAERERRVAEVREVERTRGTDVRANHYMIQLFVVQDPPMCTIVRCS